MRGFEKALLFLKKKKQKNVWSRTTQLNRPHGQTNKSFLLLFFKKEVLAFTFLALPAHASLLICGGVVAPGLAYPDQSGAWHGVEIDICGKVAARLHARPVFTPILQDSDTPPATSRSILFAPAGDIPAGYQPGQVIFNDTQALMVPVWSTARSAKDLADAEICVEPGSPEDFNLTGYFAAQKIPLREFVFQETDEMHDAYVAGRCDAITARISLLRGLRANEDGARANDHILPDDLGDNPVRVATPAGQPGLALLLTDILEQTNDVKAND
jgi:general L-amino acid transport system substrate-binding protein